jgi:hypothetical protein
MPWKEVSPMSERSRFIHDRLSTEWSMAELCSNYGISRKTGYKWLNRFLEEGRPGLTDRSRAPLSCPHKTPDHIVQLLIEARKHHPHWGPKKLLAMLYRKPPPLGLAGSEHRGRYPLAQRPRHVTKEKTLPRPSRKTRHTHDRTQRDLDHRLQGPVQDPERQVLLPPHRRRRIQQIPARVPCLPQSLPPGHKVRARRSLQGVRPPVHHPIRQRDALRLHCSREDLKALRLVDQARHLPRAHRACAPPAERKARTHAQNPQG